MITVTKKELNACMKKHCGFWTKRVFRDRKYRLLEYAQIVETAFAIPKPRHYITDLYDCDDQADWIFAHLKSKAPGIACFYIKAVNKEEKKGHAWVGVVDAQQQICNVYVETNGEIVISGKGERISFYHKYPTIESVRF